MSTEVAYMYTNYPEIQEIWHIVVPTQHMYEFFRSVEDDPMYGSSQSARMVQLGKIIHDRCHHPHKSNWRWYTLVRALVGDKYEYFLLWTKRRWIPASQLPLVLKTKSGWGLEPVPLLTSGFILSPDADESEKQGNRLIERI